MMNTYQNPILLQYADPDILYFKGVYYLYATSYPLQCKGYEVYSSTDLIHWENRGVCLQETFGYTDSFWAPDVKEHNGKFYMLVTVKEHLGLAIADSPLGPFVPQNGFLFESSIDGHIFFEGDQMILYYVSWREGHRYGIWGVRMKEDLITPDLSTEKLLLIAEEEYECHYAPVAEAPYLLKKDDHYYLTYSACHYISPLYCVCYATSDDPLGHFVKYKKNPILVGDTLSVSGAGHHCITTSPDGEKLFIVYHTHDSPKAVHPRNLSIGRIRFVQKEGETVLECDQPDLAPHPYPLEESENHG
jgi:beta-xylosidase